MGRTANSTRSSTCRRARRRRARSAAQISTSCSSRHRARGGSRGTTRTRGRCSGLFRACAVGPSGRSRAEGAKVIANLVLFGASGDLAGRFLLPALASLRASGRLADDFVVVGTAQEEGDGEGFRRHAAERLAEHAADVPREQRDGLVRSLRYRPADLGDADALANVLAAAGDGPVAAYLAVPPGLFGTTVTALGDAGLPSGSRVALEKPFGESLDDAVELNEVVASSLGDEAERAVFRVDHTLGMATVRNLLALRRHDPVLAAVWDSTHIEQIEVHWEEDLALEGRAGYYDGAGALKDVMQNHMLQIMCILAMEPPSGLGEAELRDGKVAALRATTPPTRDEAADRTRRARYGAGRIGDHAVPAYADEDGVDPARGPETFPELRLTVDAPRRDGTRFVLRAGKALGRRRKEVVVRFRSGHGEALHIGIDGP